MPRDFCTNTGLTQKLFSDWNKVIVLNYSFGAKLRSPKLGIIYNDQLLDTYENVRLKEFKLAIDELKPYKRPVSLASPSIILDEAGDVKMVFGAAGGKYIATALAQVSEYQSFIYNYYAASLSAKILCFLYSFACFFVLSISSNFLLLLFFFDFDFNFWSVKGKNGTTWQTCLWRTKFISHFNRESFLKPLLL